MKSPNMMSTTGRMPVIAAPTARPVKPASEIGVSITRCVPNSSTKPERTLNGVPASATSSPNIQTRESRRISSASASRTASAKVISRCAVMVSGIDILLRFRRNWIRRVDREFNGSFHFCFDFGLNAVEGSSVRVILPNQPIGESLDGIAFGHPLLLFLLRPVIFAVDVADVMAAIAVGIAEQESRTFPLPGSLDEFLCDGVDRSHILPVHRFRLQSKSRRASGNITRSCFREMRVLRIHIVFADVKDRKIPKSREIHLFVKNALPESTFAEEADGGSLVSQMLGGKCRAGGDANASRDNRICPQVAGGRVRDVHGTALALAIA